MLRPKRVKNGTTGAGGISSIVVAWLIFGWSCPAFPDEQRHLQLAPIRISTTAGGDIGYTFLSNYYGGSGSKYQMLDLGANVGVRAQSYIWQPWLARVTGALGVAVSENVSSGPPTTKSGNTVITGDAALNVLAYSRFPFLARAYRMNNQTSGFLSGINSDYLNSGYNLTQNYRSRDGRLDSLASYDHSTGGRTNIGTEDITNSLSFTLSTQPQSSHYTFRVVGLMNNVDHPLAGDTGSLDTLVANHLYLPDDVLSVGTLVNLIKTSLTITPGSGPKTQSDSNSQQFSSVASWRPEASPITTVGSARIFRSNSSKNGVTTAQFDDTNLNIGANYAWSPLIRMYGSVNVNDNSGIQTTSTNAGLSAQKGFGERPDAITLGGWRYTRYVGASLSNQTTTITTAATNTPSQTTNSSVQNLGGSLGHDLSKSTKLDSSLVRMDLNQGLTTGVSTVSSPVTRLLSGGSVAWNRMEGITTTAIRLHGIDSRFLSGKKSFFQLINLQASRDEQVGRNQTLTGSLTISGSRSGGKGTPTTPFIIGSSGTLSYHHYRLFGVKNMTFESTLNIIGADLVSNQNLAYQQGLTTQNQARVSWDNNLDYFIGRVKMKLYTHIAEVNKVTQYSIYFNIHRSF